LALPIRPIAKVRLDTLKAQAAALQKALGSGVRIVETPALGRTEFNGTDELLKALAYVNDQIARLEGGAESRTQPVIAHRGLWPLWN
jgi:hypothetical protein